MQTSRPSKRQILLAAAAASAFSAVGGLAFGQGARPGYPPTNTDESKVRNYTLPDLMVLQNGTSVRTVHDWQARRRPEIMRLLAENQEGETPKKVLKPLYTVVDKGTPSMGGLAVRRQVRISFSKAKDTPAIRVLLLTPATAKGPVPVFFYTGFEPAIRVLDEPGVDVGMAWAAATKSRVPDRDAARVGNLDLSPFLKHGFGVAYVYYQDIEPDFDGGAQFGVRELFQKQEGRERRPKEWGAMGAWAWGMSRVMDWLVTNKAVDGKKIAVAGASRMGKATLWAGAQDERFAMVIPFISGEGGASISRRNFGETIGDLMDPKRYPYWFAPRYDGYSKDVDRLPVDGHMLLAMAAPRPVLQICGSEDDWSDPKGEFIASLAAKPVWELYGKRGIDLTTYPAPGAQSLNDMGYYVHKGPHTVAPGDLTVVIAFMEKHFGQPA
jgi:hypothetical protein